MDWKKYVVGALTLLLVACLAVAVFVVVDARSDTQAIADENALLRDSLTIANANAATFEEKVLSLSGEVDSIKTTIGEQTITINDLIVERDAALANLETIKDVVSPTPMELVGYRVDDLYLGDGVGFSLDDGDLEKLQDGTVEFDDELYDVHETFNSDASMTYVLYSAVDDEEFGADPKVGFVSRGALTYEYVFDDELDASLISDDEPLTISFLGETLEIVKLNGDEMVVRNGNALLLREGDSVVVGEKTLKVNFIGENEVVSVCVDGECDFLKLYETETINGLDVRLEEVLVNSREGIAKLRVADDTLVTYDSGDEYPVKDSVYDFNIVMNGVNINRFVVSYEEEREDFDDVPAPLGVGDSLSFPNGFLTLTFDHLVGVDYKEFRFEFEGFDEELWDETLVDNDACGLITTDDEDIEVAGEDVSEVRVCGDGKAYYQDNTDDWYETVVSGVTLVNDNTKVSLAVGGAGRLQFNNPSDSQIRLTTDWSAQVLGAEEDEAEIGDVLFGVDGVGTKEYDFITPFGTVLSEPENGADRDEFSFSLPSERVELVLVVS